MHIHHLNCGTHCPIGGAFYDGASRGLHADICTHCLLIETDSGLVLVDTGYGIQDVRNAPRRRLSHLWPAVLNVRFDEADTALRQVERLGFAARDVRHVILTHLDFDHAGGLEDFPEAQVHVMTVERDAALNPRRSFVGNQRYRPLQWDAVRNWTTYQAQGERWFGFEAVRQLQGLPPEILMIPLRGHTLGHAGVAMNTSSGWLFHAGDAYLHRDELNFEKRQIPPGLAIYEAIMMTDAKAGAANLDRLRLLGRYHGHEVRVFCSHDTVQLKSLQNQTARTP